jgi:hypothetical protein
MNQVAQRRRDSLRKLSHVISLKLYRLGVSYLDRGTEIPIEFVERVFDDECKVARLRGGPLNATKIEAKAVLSLEVST